MEDLRAQAPALIKGLGTIAGVIAVGVNGPFLFERFEWDTPIAITAGVTVGAAAGFIITAITLWLRHPAPAAKPAHHVPAGARFHGSH